MQFNELWAALRRRWYLVIVVLLLSVGGGFGVAKMVGPTYETQGAVLVLPPGSSGNGSAQTVGNPFLSLAGVSQVRDVVIRTMMSKTFHEELCSTTGDAEYEQMTSQMCQQSPAGITFEATPDFTSGAPLILVTVDSKSPTTGAVALKAVVDRVPGILSELQADLGLRPKALVTSTEVVMDFQPDVVHKKQIRAALLAGAGILGLGLLAVGLLDSMLIRRHTRGGGDVEAKGSIAGKDPSGATASDSTVRKARRAWVDEEPVGTESRTGVKGESDEPTSAGRAGSEGVETHRSTVVGAGIGDNRD